MGTFSTICFYLHYIINLVFVYFYEHYRITNLVLTQILFQDYGII